MEAWQKQLLTLLASVGWLLSIAVVLFMLSFYVNSSNPLRGEAVAGVAIPIVYGAPVWLGLGALLFFKWQALSKQQRYLSGLPVVIALAGLLWSSIIM